MGMISALVRCQNTDTRLTLAIKSLVTFLLIIAKTKTYCHENKHECSMFLCCSHCVNPTTNIPRGTHCICYNNLSGSISIGIKKLDCNVTNDGDVGGINVTILDVFQASLYELYENDKTIQPIVSTSKNLLVNKLIDLIPWITAVECHFLNLWSKPISFFASYVVTKYQYLVYTYNCLLHQISNSNDFNLCINLDILLAVSQYLITLM